MKILNFINISVFMPALKVLLLSCVTDTSYSRKIEFAYIVFYLKFLSLNGITLVSQWYVIYLLFRANIS